MKNKKLKWRNLYLIFIFLLLYLPILYLILYSFNRGGDMNHFTGFTLDYYKELLSDKRLIAIVINTLLIALLSSLIATVIGTIGAVAIYNVKNNKVKNTILSLNNILMVSPDVIIGASFLIFFTFLGLGLGFGSVLLSHIAFSIPIVVLMVLPKLLEMNDSTIDAAHDLGATPIQTLVQIILPSISPGIFAGFFMALTYSLDDFAVTFFVTGNGFTTLSVEIYSRARQGVSLEINALSAVIFVVALGLVIGYYIISQRSLSKKQRQQRKREVQA